MLSSGEGKIKKAHKNVFMLPGMAVPLKGIGLQKLVHVGLEFDLVN